MRLGILTGGGDCPGLNAAIRSVVRSGIRSTASRSSGSATGGEGSWTARRTQLTNDDVRGILPRGGTILGTSGTQPSTIEGGPDLVRAAIAAHALDGFVVIGGEGTMGTTAAMPDVPVVGIPKTIDNDIGGTDASIGFWTAAQIATDSIDRLYSTAESHNRVMVCEVMGRSAGMDRHHGRPRRGCRRDRHPRAPVRHRARLRADPERARAAALVLDRRGRQRGSRSRSRAR